MGKIYTAVFKIYCVQVLASPWHAAVFLRNWGLQPCILVPDHISAPRARDIAILLALGDGNDGIVVMVVDFPPSVMTSREMW